MLVIGAVSGTSVANGESPSATPPEKARIRDALEVLARVPTGKNLLREAQQVFGAKHRDGLLEHFEWGEVSRTDAVLTRHYNPQTRSEERERRVKVILKRNQSLPDLVFDVAHELTHAVQKPSWDPYDPELTASKYIYAAIEGRGGEVDAVVNECQVGFELSLQYGTSVERCRRYRGKSEGVDRARVKSDFYRVGQWRKNLLEELGPEAGAFQFEAEAPVLYSSTGNAPYPVALLREFSAINRAACQNSVRRLELTRASSASPDPGGRSPASASSADFHSGESPAVTALITAENALSRFLARRCRSH